MSVIRYVGYETTITVLDEDGIPVAQLVCDHLETIAILQRLHGIGVTPIVEGGTWKFEKGRSAQVLVEYPVFAYPRKEEGGFRKVLRMIREELPGPQLRGANDSISPGSL